MITKEGKELQPSEGKKPDNMTENERHVLSAYNATQPTPWADVAYLVAERDGDKMYRVRNTKHHGKIGAPVFIVLKGDGMIREVEAWSEEMDALFDYLIATGSTIW